MPAGDATGRNLPAPQAAGCQDDGSIIDVLVAYSTQARDETGGTDAILALINQRVSDMNTACLLYTSDAADERSSVDLGGRRIIKKKNTRDKNCQYKHITLHTIH